MKWSGKLKKIDECRYEIDSSYRSDSMINHGVRMNVAGVIYSDDCMISDITADDSPEQVANVATLPGIVGKSIAMPDIHHGYGFAIGGVAAFDAEMGIISPGGVGYDINCGVRLIRSDLEHDDIKDKVDKLINAIFRNVPCGVGSEGRVHLNMSEIDSVLKNGSGWAVKNGYGWEEDLVFTEEQGAITGADHLLVSANAKKRGLNQLGSLGAGNHFLEIQKVDKIYDEACAQAFGINRIGQITVMIHTGSRGLGHQICTDYLDLMRKANQKYKIPMIDRELSCAPVTSSEAQQYFKAMKCGANYAWANRQMITHWIRESFEQVLKETAVNLGMHQIYDIAHNMAKFEEHFFEGKNRQLYVHRKGATRAFGPGHPVLPDKYSKFGQPVLIPGDMGSASYLLAGTEKAMKETFGSSCHGAGRFMSRTKAIKNNPADRVINDLKSKGIYLQARSRKVISEEAPEAYKDIDRVVEVTHRAGIAKKVCRLVPLGVAKG